MRLHTLVEQMADYDHATETFTFTDPIPGRLTFEQLSASGLHQSGRDYYRAATEDESQWEIGVLIFSGGESATRSAVILSSADGFPVEFTSPVRLTLTPPAGSYLCIDTDSSGASATANGESAMAAGRSAEARGLRSIAFGYQAKAGISGFERDDAVAIGSGAQALHHGAVSIGQSAYSVLARGIHGYGSVHWASLQQYSDGAESINMLDAAGLEPALPESVSMVIDALVVAKRVDTEGDAFSARVSGLIRRGSSGAAEVVGTPSITEIAKSIGVTVSCDLVAVGTEGGFAIEVTGAAAQEWEWSVSFHGAWV